MPDASEEIKAVLARQLGIKEGEVLEQAKLDEDLGADSLDIIEFLSILEEKFDIQIPEKDGDKIKTVEDLIVYVKGKIPQK